MKKKLIEGFSLDRGKVRKIWMTMRLIVFLFFVSLIHVSASVYSQKTKLNLKLENATLQQAFNAIQEQSEFDFFYKNEQIPANARISIQYQDEAIDVVLDKILKGTGLTYHVMDKDIVISASGVQGNEVTSQQLKIVTGKVIDTTDFPLPGVSVVLKGTTNGTITDTNGIFSLINVPENSVLVFSFIGMKSQEVNIGGKTNFNITLEEDNIGLEEVLVTGYSTERKKDIIGSVAVINTEKLMQTNAATVGGQLQGRAAGVFVSSDGSPEGQSKVRIRGFGSFGGSDPLYIIDGVSATSDAFNNINPNDVESIQILKDAASASVYGARAANGVVIISTKKGKAGSAKVSISSFSGVNYVSSKNFPELLNAKEYGEYWWAASKGAGINPTHAQYGSGTTPVIPEYIKAGSYGGAALESYRSSNPALFAQLVDPANYNFQTNQIVKSADTNWFDEVYNPAKIRSIQIGISGGSDKGTYSVSLNYYNQGDASNQYKDFNRYTTRANSTFKIAKNITVGENLQIAFANTTGEYSPLSTNTLGRSSLSAATAWTMNPICPVWDINGNPAGGAAAGLGNVVNPIAAEWRNRFDKNLNFGAFGNAYADVIVLKDFVFHTSFGINYSTMDNWDLTQQTYENSENTSISTLSRAYTGAISWTWTNTMTYSKVFGKHSAKVLLGHEAIRDYNTGITAARTNYDINDDPNFVVLDSGLGTQSNSGKFARNMLESQFVRMDYTFADKYLINATVRRDGSSKFGKNNRFGVFPAVALGWRISEENFMKTISWLDDLKLRTSYGIIGNQNGLSATNQYSQYNNTVGYGYAINGGNSVFPGYAQTTIGNPDARWEKSITSNIGFDATILKGKFSVNFEYYIKQTKDLLVQNQAANTGSSATQPSVNVGDMTNKGVDLNITNRGHIVKNLTYEASVNFSAYKNEVTKILDSPDSYLTGYSDNGMGVITRTISGMPLSYIWGYKIDGFFETDAEASAYASEYKSWITPKVGRWRIKDISGPNGVPDKVIDDYDRTKIGSPHPDFQVGFNLSMQYRNFDFSTFIFWNQGGQVYNLSRRNTDMVRWNLNRSKRMLYQSWTSGADNSNALLPKLDLNDSESPSAASDYFVENITYVRMKSLQIGYTLPASSKLMKDLKIEKLRIYLQGQNIFTVLGGKKPFSGLDPDASLAGTDISMGAVESQNPTPKQFVIGLNLDF